MKNPKFKQFCLYSLFIGLMFSLSACGQRVAVQEPEGYVQDSRSY